MKKNKQLTRLLLVMVLGIWGLIFYRVFNFGSDSSNDFVVQNYKLPSIVKNDKSVEKYELIANYSDPFLLKKKRSSRKRKSSKAKRGKKGQKNKSSSIQETLTPKVVYKGYSVNKNNDITRVRLEINGQNHTVKLNQTIEGVELKSMHRNFVVLAFKKEEWELQRLEN